MEPFFSSIITSKMRINILMRLFINPNTQVYLRELSKEFNASPSHIKDELDSLKRADLLKSKKKGRQILFSANTEHPIYNELHSIVRKALGMDKILDSIIYRLGNLKLAILTGVYAEGKDTGIIDLVLIGNINTANLDDLIAKTEKYIDRKIKPVIYSMQEYESVRLKLTSSPHIILWKKIAASSEPQQN